MITIKGHYDWKLIDKETNEVVSSGEQDNLVTDRGLEMMLLSDSDNVWGTNASRIFLSSATPSSASDYRQVRSGNPFTTDSIGAMGAIAASGTFKVGEVNFNPLAQPLTIRVIGLIPPGTNNLISFIELTTPITQQTNQFFFVRYRVEVAYTGAGINGVVNDFVKTKAAIIHTNSYSNTLLRSSLLVIPTRFRRPGTLSLCGRHSGQNLGLPSFTQSLSGSLLGYKYINSSSISQAPGPHGAVLVGPGNSTIPRQGIVVSVPSVSSTPEISTVFSHGVGDTSYFSNPSIAPTSKGSLIVSGDSSSDKIFKTVSVIISNTGEASDISASGKFFLGVNLAISAVQNQFSALPVDFRGVWRPLTLDGNIITDEVADYVAGVFGESTLVNSMVVSAVTPFGLDSSGEYLYAAIKEPLDLTTTALKIAKWRFNTPESFLQLSGIDIARQDLTNGIMLGHHLWLSTNSGLVKINTSASNALTTYTSADGLLQSQINELGYDEVSQYLWLCHDNGYTKWNPTNSVVVSSISNSLHLSPLTNNQTMAHKSRFHVRDGILFRGGRPAVSASTANPDTESPYIFNEKTSFWFRINTSAFPSNRCNNICLMDPNSTSGISVVVDYTGATATGAGRVARYNVFLSGTNSGSLSLAQSATCYDAAGSVGISPGIAASKMFRINKNHLMWLNTKSTENPTRARTIEYSFDDNIVREYSIYSSNASGGERALVTSPWTDNAISLSVDGVTCVLYAGQLVGTIRPQQYGWNYSTSAWDKDSTSARNIPDSIILSAVNNLSFNFDNAVGFPVNQQFIAGENFMFLTGPGKIKTNLQTMTYKMYNLFGDLKTRTDVSASIPGVSPYTVSIPDISGADFKGMLNDADYVTIKAISGAPSGITYSEVASSPSSGQYSTSGSTGTLIFSSADAGKGVLMSYQYLERH